MDADVLIQAGHEGRTSGATGAVGKIDGRTVREIEWTPVVADAATVALRAAGYKVLRYGATLTGTVDVAVFAACHFDGSGSSCASGASIGYPTGTPAGSNRMLADTWRDVYAEVWPYKWMGDNFTKALSGYYGYKHANTSIGEMVVEFGEITCPKQAGWLEPRLTDLGGLLAHAISKLLPGRRVPIPARFALDFPPPKEPPVMPPPTDPTIPDPLPDSARAMWDRAVSSGLFAAHEPAEDNVQRWELAAILERVFGPAVFATRNYLGGQ